MNLDGKICNKCNEFKTYSEFYKHRNNKDGYVRRCKPCALLEIKKKSGFDHENQREVELAKELLLKLGYDLDKPINEQFEERFIFFRNGQG